MEPGGFNHRGEGVAQRAAGKIDGDIADQFRLRLEGDFDRPTQRAEGGGQRSLFEAQRTDGLIEW